MVRYFLQKKNNTNISRNIGVKKKKSLKGGSFLGNIQTQKVGLMENID